MKNKMNININIDINSNDATLKFVLGQHQDGSRVEFLDFQELEEILTINNVLGENGLLLKERDALKKDLSNRKGATAIRIEKMESLIYDTLAKYIIKLFYAGTEQIIFPSVLPLEKHKNSFS